MLRAIPPDTYTSDPFGSSVVQVLPSSLFKRGIWGPWCWLTCSDSTGKLSSRARSNPSTCGNVLPHGDIWMGRLFPCSAKRKPDGELSRSSRMSQPHRRKAVILTYHHKTVDMVLHWLNLQIEFCNKATALGRVPSVLGKGPLAWLSALWEDVYLVPGWDGLDTGVLVTWQWTSIHTGPSSLRSGGPPEQVHLRMLLFRSSWILFLFRHPDSTEPNLLPSASSLGFPELLLLIVEDSGHQQCLPVLILKSQILNYRFLNKLHLPAIVFAICLPRSIIIAWKTAFLYLWGLVALAPSLWAPGNYSRFSLSMIKDALLNENNQIKRPFALSSFLHSTARNA